MNVSQKRTGVSSRDNMTATETTDEKRAEEESHFWSK